MTLLRDEGIYRFEHLRLLEQQNILQIQSVQEILAKLDALIGKKNTLKEKEDIEE